MSTAANPFRPLAAAIAAPSPDSTKIDSYWPHHALTYQVAGTSRTAPAAATAHRGRSRSAKAMSAASPRSARDAGTFMRARIAGSPGSVTFAKAGWTALRRLHT